MRPLAGLSAALWLTLSLAWPACAGSLTVFGGNLSLAISTATAGQEPDAAIDESTTLRFKKESTEEPTLKITVATNLASPIFVLEIGALNADAGNPTGTLILGTAAQDLLTDISNTKNKTCHVRYSASATVAEGTGADSHTVTFTIVAQ